MKIKISRLDHKFSNYIRWVRDKGICQRCKKQFCRPAGNLHNSHFHGRRKKSVRFDLDNCVAACFSCHRYLTENPADHRDFFFKRLGETQYDLLTIRANTPNKPDYKAIEIWLDIELKQAGF